MKIRVFVIVSDTEVRNLFEQKRANLVPQKIRDKAGRIEFKSLPANINGDNLLSEIINVCENYDCFGIVVERGCTVTLETMRGAVFSYSFCPYEAKKTDLTNYFTHHLTKWLDNLIFLRNLFDNFKQKKCLILPRGNFEACDLDKLYDVVCEENLTPAFKEEVEITLKEIRNRSKPKRRSAGKKQFLIDDNDRHFELGHERHSFVETNRQKHELTCVANAYARFGLPLDRQQHYNVTKDNDNISGTFICCHNSEVLITNQSHINMFPNRFMT